MAGKKKAAGGNEVEAVAATKGGSTPTSDERRLMVPGGCRTYMRKTLAKEFPEIVQGFVEAAKTGSCTHVKLVTELMRPIRQYKPRQKKGPARRFIEKLEKEYEEREKLRQEAAEFEQPTEVEEVQVGEVERVEEPGTVTEEVGPGAGEATFE